MDVDKVRRRINSFRDRIPRRCGVAFWSDKSPETDDFCFPDCHSVCEFRALKDSMTFDTWLRLHFKLEAKHVLPNINHTQAAERAEKCRFCPW